ncbi:MAG: class I SAM-dependent RNA methyltransferase [Saprospiraceae bacterium]|nr:class I SAM-dependent RNA methyltransferase [Saprospiraceae bacterium]
MDKFNMVAKTLMGLEQVLADEIASIGGEDIELGYRAVEFRGTIETMYKANLLLRTAMRILVPIASFDAYNEKAYYDQIRLIEWDKFMNKEDTLAVDAIVCTSFSTHSHYVALKAKDAIVDYFRDKYGIRPSVDTFRPTLQVNIHLSKDHCTVSLDSSGEPLFKRGYREAAVEAPLSEVLAAGILKLTGWDKQTPLYDPMCGSGTFLTEAAMMATNTPPQIMRRHFTFQYWMDFDKDLWIRLKKEAYEAVTPLSTPIVGSDRDRNALIATRKNLVSLGLEDQISLKHVSFEDSHPPFESGMIVMNPPYNERLRESENEEMYKIMGDQLKKTYQGYTAWIISSDLQAIKCIGLHASKRISTMNGSLDCKLLRYDLYSGSKKAKYNVNN